MNNQENITIPNYPEPTQKPLLGRKVLISLSLVFIAALAALGYFLFSQQQSSDPISTEGWQTYKNKEYGFEFKYPKDLTVNKSNNVLYLVGEGSNGMLNENQSWLTIAPQGLDQGAFPFDSVCDITQSIIFSGKDAVECLNMSEFYEERFINILDPLPSFSWKPLNLIFYQISKHEGIDTNNDIGLVNQILSTFKFIE